MSIGIQTLDDSLLPKLGRIHNAQTAINAVHFTREAGIENISIDLMYDLPDQSSTRGEKTLEEVTKLPM